MLEKTALDEVGPTALALPMTSTYDLDLQSHASTVMTWSLAKVQGQRQSVPKMQRKRTDGGDCITSLPNALGKNCRTWKCEGLT